MKKWIWIILAVLIAALSLAGWKAYQDYYDSTYITIGGTEYRRNIALLDLSGGEVPELTLLAELKSLQKLDLQDTGLTVQQYQWLRDNMPNCQILWKVPFQNSYLEEDETVLTVTSLSEEDVDRLAYFPKLQKIDAVGCRDYEVLMALQAARPELELSYSVSIGGQEYREDTTELALENGDGGELIAALPYLPQLTTVTLTGTTPENSVMSQAIDLRPDVDFYWDFTLFGVETSSTATELYLNEIPMESTEEVEEALKFFHNLTWVEMCDCGIPSEEMDALAKRHPETRFVWTVDIGRCHLRTDTTAFIPYTFGYMPRVSVWDPYHRLFDEDCVELKYCVDMVCLDLGHMPLTDYSFLEYMPKMKYLILADTRGTDFSVLAQLKELVFVELFMTEFNQPEVLTGLTNLEDLNLGFTPLQNEEVLMEMTWLKRLWLPGTNIGETRYRSLQQALPDTIVMYYAEHSTASGWRQSPNYYDMRDLLGMIYLT